MAKPTATEAIPVIKMLKLPLKVATKLPPKPIKNTPPAILPNSFQSNSLAIHIHLFQIGVFPAVYIIFF